MQRFLARERFEFTNGAVGWAPGGPFDCLGPYAKVQNCPVEGEARRYTCYARGHGDTFFTVPAVTRIRGKVIKGCFMFDGDGGLEFHPYFPQQLGRKGPQGYTDIQKEFAEKWLGTAPLSIVQYYKCIASGVAPYRVALTMAEGASYGEAMVKNGGRYVAP